MAIELDQLRAQFGTADFDLDDVLGRRDATESGAGAEGPGPRLESGNGHLMSDDPRTGPNEESDEERATGSEPREPSRQSGGVHLTERELEVLSYMALGWETTSIAEELGVSSYTARNHVRNIRRKLDAANRLEAVMTAMRLGIISSE